MKRLFAVLLGVLCFWTWRRRYREHIARITASGHMCRPSPTVIFLARCLFKLLSFIWVGRVVVKGRENLHAGLRLIVTPNHSSLLDAVVCYATFSRDVWAMGADDVMRWGGGLVGLLATKMRTMPVDRSHGKTVIEPATRLILKGNTLVMFPEGKIDPTGQGLPYKLGAAVIGNCVFEQLEDGDRIGIVPTAILYHRRHNASATNFFCMGFKWRGGCTIIHCEPIWFDKLDNRDPVHVMGLVKAAIEAALRSAAER